MRRVFDVDILRCPRCDHRLVILAAINDPFVAQKILRHLGLSADGPRVAPARGPPEPELDFDIEPDPQFECDDDIERDEEIDLDAP